MPSETLLRKSRPFARPTSTLCSFVLSKAASAANGSSRSRPRSLAKWLRVPNGTTTKGRSRSIAIWATGAREPSPPATPSGPSGAVRAISAGSSSGPRRCVELTREELAHYAGEYRHAVVALAETAAKSGNPRHAKEEAEHVALWDE